VSSRTTLPGWITTSLAAALGVVLAGAGPREVELKPGETLPAVARRELGDARAAAELRAFNGLSADPSPGTRIRLPGEERDRAVRAIAAARNALQQIDAGALREEAAKRIRAAEQHLAGARYPDAASTADAAWKLLSSRAPEQTRFTVAVDDRGDTEVVSRSGRPVRVEAQGVQRVAGPGRSVKVTKGSPPSLPVVPPSRPALSSPGQGAVLELKSDLQGRLGPVRLAWSGSDGARSYEVQLTSGSATAPLVFTSATNAIELPALVAGTYSWTVKALGEHAIASPPAEPRTFELRPQRLKLEVHGTDWKAP
jgi:hypothetical protein